MNELAEFLLARVSEDEEVSRAVLDVGVHDERPMVKEWLVRANPRRLLVWSDARRRIIALHESTANGHRRPRPGEPAVCRDCGAPEPCSTLRLMSLPYADHPDYHEAWRP